MVLHRELIASVANGSQVQLPVGHEKGGVGGDIKPEASNPLIAEVLMLKGISSPCLLGQNIIVRTFQRRGKHTWLSAPISCIPAVRKS